MNGRPLLCFLLFAFLADFLPAQETDPPPRILTLEEACILAEQNSISLQRRAVDLEIDRTRAKNLWAQVFPSINVRGRADYTIPNQEPPRTDPSYSATLSLRLDLSAGLPLVMTNISLAYKNSLLNFEQARLQIINQTTKSYYSLLAQKNNVAFLEGTLRLATEQLNRDRIARQNGYMGEVDFLSAQASTERSRLAYNRALTDYQNSLGKFLAALGLDQREQTELEGAMEIPARLSLDPDALINERLLQRPDMVIQRNELERLKNAHTEIFLSAKAPSVELSASWGATLQNGLNDTVSAGIAVVVPIDPWIPGTRQDQTAKRAGAEYQKAQLELKDMEKNARLEIRSYTDSINNIWSEVEISRTQANLARRAYDLAAQAYRSGGLSFNNFETARNRYTEARQQQLQSELNYKILVLDLASSLNMTEDELNAYSR